MKVENKEIKRHAKNIVRKLTNREQMKDEEGYFNYLADERLCVDIVEKYLEKMKEIKNIEQPFEYVKLDNNNIDIDTLLAVNYAFQKTFDVGGSQFVLKEKDLIEIHNLIDFDNPEKTGQQLWDWLRGNIGKHFYMTGSDMSYIGLDFIKEYNKFKRIKK